MMDNTIWWQTYAFYKIVKLYYFSQKNFFWFNAVRAIDACLGQLRWSKIKHSKIKWSPLAILQEIVAELMKNYSENKPDLV